jgi:tetratricopeptide (TPR) repeat protein
VDWIQTPTWEESEAFLTSHRDQLLSADGQATLAALASANPGNETIDLHVNLLNVAQRDGVATAYSQLRAELAAAGLPEVLHDWLACAPDWPASAAYLAQHPTELTDPAVLAVLVDACDRKPDDPRLWLHRGLLLMGDGVAAGYAALDAGGREPARRAEELLAAGALDQALAWAYLARGQDNGQGALLVGRVQLDRGDTDRAAEALSDATMAVTPDQVTDLLAAYERLLHAQPDEPWRYAEYANALERAGRWEDAVAAYDQAIALAPDNASLHFNKGHSLFGLGQFTEAASELAEVTRLRPNDVLGASVLLAAIAWPNDPDAASGHFGAALASPGERLKPFTRAFYRAVALAGLGRTGEALADLEGALPSRTAGETSLDETDRRLLGRFLHPPLPGLDALFQLLDAPPHPTQ